MHHILFYDVAPDYLERRAAHRSEHLKLAEAAHARGDLVLAGALAEPADGAGRPLTAADRAECDSLGAVFVFRSREAAEAFPKSDPYVANGLVTNWRVRAWMTVVGDGATPPR